jgi:outer membrane protein OmpA-like peptidoglycan-associated protein
MEFLASVLALSLGLTGAVAPPSPIFDVSTIRDRGLEIAWWEAITESNRPVDNSPVDKSSVENVAPSPREVTFTIPGSLFATDSAVLDDVSQARIAGLAKIDVCAATKVVIAGATDDTGTRARNIELSGERANAVASVVRQACPNVVVPVIEAWADDRPAVRTDGLDLETRRALNRRVVIIVTTER